MSKKETFGRNEIQDFIRNMDDASWDEENSSYRLLNECGCEDAQESVFDAVAIDQSPSSLGAPADSIIEPNPLLPDLFGPIQLDRSQHAPCPDSYNTAAEFVVQDPQSVVDMLMPAMQDLGIGCPASLAQAVGDVLGVSQQHGITDVYNTQPVEVEEPMEIEIDIVEEALKKFRSKLK